MIRDHRTNAGGNVRGGGVPSDPKLISEFSASELKSISFCYMASENAASQITDLRVMPLLIAKLE
jgi:hypothetical protein